jgi:hypothetical protein
MTRKRTMRMTSFLGSGVPRCRIRICPHTSCRKITEKCDPKYSTPRLGLCVKRRTYLGSLAGVSIGLGLSCESHSCSTDVGVARPRSAAPSLIPLHNRTTHSGRVQPGSACVSDSRRRLEWGVSHPKSLGRLFSHNRVTPSAHYVILVSRHHLREPHAYRERRPWSELGESLVNCASASAVRPRARSA